MTSHKPFTLIAAVLLAIMAVAHVYRLATGLPITVGSHSIPVGLSWIATALLALLAVMLFREARR